MGYYIFISAGDKNFRDKNKCQYGDSSERLRVMVRALAPYSSR
jgi:hypothetical protein